MSSIEKCPKHPLHREPCPMCREKTGAHMVPPELTDQPAPLTDEQLEEMQTLITDCKAGKTVIREPMVEEVEQLIAEIRRLRAADGCPKCEVIEIKNDEIEQLRTENERLGIAYDGIDCSGHIGFILQFEKMVNDDPGILKMADEINRLRAENEKLIQALNDIDGWPKLSAVKTIIREALKDDK